MTTENPDQSALVHLRVSLQQKAEWVRKSRAAGMKLGDWIVRAIESQSVATPVTTTSGLARPITPDDLRRWQAEMGLTYTTAAQALGVNRATYARWLSGESAIPGTVDLACAALIERLAPYSHRDHRSDS